MRINTLCKKMVCATLFSFTTSAYVFADHAQATGDLDGQVPGDVPVLEEPEGCPVAGMEQDKYWHLYLHLNQHYPSVQEKLNRFMGVYIFNGANINTAVNNAYAELGEAARRVAECRVPNNFADDTIPEDCKYRVLVALQDGTVVFDLTAGTNNTASNFKAKSINENHNTRLAVQWAQHNDCGNAWETHFSTTNLVEENYVAQRLGHKYDNSGIIVISKLHHAHSATK